MHKSSYHLMERLLVEYDSPTPRRVLDVGSAVYGTKHPNGKPLLGGSYRRIIEQKLKSRNWSYTGLDVAPAPNVDIVATELYHWPVETGSYDLVISGQCMEHVPELHRWMNEIFRVCAPNGLAIIIAPSAGPEHRFPVDCWRILPDGMEYIMRGAGFEIVEVKKHNIIPWCDCWGVGRKPEWQDEPDRPGI